jgi:hypothetical protein
MMYSVGTVTAIALSTNDNAEMRYPSLEEQMGDLEAKRVKRIQRLDSPFMS